MLYLLALVVLVLLNAKPKCYKLGEFRKYGSAYEAHIYFGFRHSLNLPFRELQMCESKECEFSEICRNCLEGYRTTMVTIPLLCMVEFSEFEKLQN